MLTKRQNLMETIKGGNPDRFVKQYEFMNMIFEAAFPLQALMLQPGQENQDGWGVTWRFVEGQVAGFPVHDQEHIVIKDITKWKDYVKKPVIPTDDESWAPAIAHAESIDRNEEFVTAMMAPGVFEMTHHMMGMENALMALYEEPEAMHELVDYITGFELEFAQLLVDRIKPDCLFHHDDWGSQISSLVSPEIFDEFFLPAYKKIYGFWKDNGVEVIVHHSDSFAANLVPEMIEMGVDIWQGCMTTNNVPELVEKYGGQISFMGDLDSGTLDFPGWTPELISEHVERACKNNGKHYFIPCLTMGGPESLFPGAYAKVSEEIDKMSKEIF
ncbi:uroporphyrinogen decarboxylase family protein [Alkalibacter mobilis]|uniref:uroporphyrinogen decarboxylase family protein n=1 Tax=Alkalibacter mobilis TaxID=2787712 RepID=UPI00189F7079|nr:uroporphyrinogen decarboxylase family protein [Alkalibacter mobilis]MBF7095629.1 uroporphyrinogen decarboxylase [Alkalibacter mobilis]